MATGDHGFSRHLAGDQMATFLGARTGWLQGDGYAGHEQLYGKNCPCIEVAAGPTPAAIL